MRDVIGRRRWFYAISALLTIPGLLFLLLGLVAGNGIGLKFSIAYTGGTIWEVHFAEGAPDPEAVLAILEEQGLEGEVNRTVTDGRTYTLIRTEALQLRDPGPAPVPSAAPDASAAPAASPAVAPVVPAASSSPAPQPSPTPAPVVLPTEGQFGALATALVASFGPIDEVRQLTSVGPVVSAELIQQTFLLILMGAVGIMLWITFRFGDFRMGATALAALVHDVLVVVGTFAILGTFVGLQVDALFVTGVLTVIGFSVHDTIVVFDRIRENRVRHAGEPYDAIVNHSILQTAGRSINTSLTVMLTLSALLLLGGDAIRSFVLALLVGISVGTYSSIFFAAPLLVDWHLRDERRRAREVAAGARVKAA
ncbi:MAG: protein translocase subunit SecF [Chloroflexota bacterium]